jgi:hypothetical protein
MIEIKPIAVRHGQVRAIPIKVIQTQACGARREFSGQLVREPGFARSAAADYRYKERTVHGWLNRGLSGEKRTPALPG